MKRILLYSDLHAANVYNYNIKKSKYNISEYSRLDELCSTLDWIAKTTKEVNAICTVNLGDTFHQALKFYTERYNTVIKSITNINQATQAHSGYILEGNHDKTDNVSAIDIFGNIKGTVLIKNKIGIQFFSEINSNLIFIPYIRSIEKTKEVFQELYKKHKDDKINSYLFCHLDLLESYEDLPSSKYQIDQLNSYDDLHLEIYKGIFSGHIHTRKTIRNNFHYIGSVLNFNFGDIILRRGLSILDIEPEKYAIKFIENPYCPMFVKFNLEKEDETIEKIKKIEIETNKYPYTNIYVRIYSLGSEKGKEQLSKFLEKYKHLFTFFEVKEVESEEEIKRIEITSAKMENINIFDMIIEQGKKILFSQGKSEQEVENYILRLKNLCNLN
jgi:DNA repair exonuclease SbcCD nuclease subunit